MKLLLLLTTLRPRRILGGTACTAWALCLLFFASIAIDLDAAQKTFVPGSLIVDMGQPTQTVGNALKPYGLIYDMTTDFKVPVDWAINPAKTTFRLAAGDPIPVDFTATITTGTKSYSGGSFIIDAAFLTSPVIAAINGWKAQGVVIDTLAAPLTTEIYGEVTSFPRSVLDTVNGKLAIPYYTNAGVPASAYNLGLPTSLDQCADVFILTHADPQDWPVAYHQSLYNFVNNGGGLWAGCHSVSEIENLFLGPTQLNFLSNGGMVPFGSHANGTPPYTYNSAAANDPIMQIFNRLDAATQNGSGQIYVPNSLFWRSTTTVAVFDPGHPQAPAGGTSPFNEAAVVAYGNAYGDLTKGLVMYEGGHSLAGTAAANIAAQRAYFNFILTTGIIKAPKPAVTIPTIVAGQTATLTATISGGSGSYSYQWISSNGGVFSKPAGTWNVGDPPLTTQYLMTGGKDTVRLLITDTCGRQGISSSNLVDAPPTIDLDANNSSGATGADYKNYFAGLSVVPAADADTLVTDNGTIIASAAIKLSTRPDGAAETLVIDTTLARSFGINVASDGNAGFVLTGTATLAQYQQVITTLQYTNSLAFPNSTDRVITVTVNDGISNSNTAVSRLSFLGASVTTVNKQLYLSDPGLGMDRSDPVATNDTTTSSVAVVPQVSSNSSGMATWTNRDTQNLVYAPWNLTSFATPRVQRKDGGSYITMASAASSKLNEAIVVGVTSDQHVSGAVWNGTAWTPISINIGGVPKENLGKPSQKQWWGAAVAYETNSGRAMLVWNTATTLNYSIWNGTSWTAAAAIPAYTAAGGVEPRQIRIASNPLPGSNEIVITVTDKNEVDRALVWNGSAWGNVQLLDNLGNHNFTDVNVAYEQQSGRAMVVYASGTAGAVGYRTWTGSTSVWSAQSLITPPVGSNNYAQWTVVAGDPNSNRIVLGVESNGSDAWMNVWSGTAWGASQLGIQDGVDQRDNLNIAVAFESKSGDALAVYENDASTNLTELQYRTFTAGAWSAGTNFFGPFANPDNNKDTRAITLNSNPYSDQVMLMVNDDQKFLHSDLWSGSSFAPPIQLQPYPLSTSDTNTTAGQPFSFFWDRHLPGVVTTSVTFTQTDPMVAPFVMPAGGAVKVTTYIQLTSGLLPAAPQNAVTVGQAGSAIVTIPAPPTVTNLGGNIYKLEWTGTVPNNATVPTGGQITLTVIDYDSSNSFNIFYDSSTYPSQVQVETATAIAIDSLGVYDAAYPGGSQIVNTTAGQPAYVRFTVSDPFGASDITSADLVIKNSSGGTVVSTTLTDTSVVASTPGSKTYEYVWSPPIGDTFTVIVTAHEGTEGVTATDQTPITAIGFPDLVVVKSDGGSTVNAGSTVPYTINYSNAGLTTATGVVITEFLPVGATFNAAGSTPGWSAVGTNEFLFPIGNLAPGATGSVVFAVSVPSPVPVGLEQLGNTVFIADDGTHGADTNPANNTSSDITPINAAPDLVITKTDGGTTTLPGGIVLYQIHYTNGGTQNSNGVLISETLPANTTFNSTYSFNEWEDLGGGVFGQLIGDLPVGASGTVTFAVNVNNPLPGGVTQIANSVSIADGGASGPDLNPANDTATDTTPIVINPQADLQITKTDSQTSVQPGSVVTYTITVTNPGPNAVTGAAFTDNVPASLSGVSYTTAVSGGAARSPTSGTGNNISGLLDLPVGGTVIYTVTGTLNPNATGTLTNVATVLPPAGTLDPNTGNNTAVDSDLVVPVSDLSLAKAFTFTDLDDSSTLTSGDQIVFALTVTNSGPNPAQNVSIEDLLPNGYTYVSDDAAVNGGTYSTGSGLWVLGTTLGATAPNNTRVLHITATVGAGGTYTNTAQIASSNSFDPDSTPDNDVTTEDDYATVTPIVPPKSDLSLDKLLIVDVTDDINVDLDHNDILSSGDRVTFKLTLHNQGPNDAANVHVTDLLPAGYSFFNASASQGTYTIATGDWNVGTVSVLSSPTLTIVATILGGKPTSAYTNYAQVSASGSFDPDSTPGDNSTAQDDDASAAPFIADLSVTKTAAIETDNDGDGSLTIGDNVIFSVTIINSGPDFTTDVQLLDQLTAGYTYVGDDSLGRYDPISGLWLVGTLAPGTAETLHIIATVNPSGPYTNSVQVTGSQQFDPDSTPNNNVPAEDDQVSITLTPGAAALPPVAVNDISLHNPPGPVTLNVTNNDTDPNLDLAVNTVDLNPGLAGQQPSFLVAGQGTWSVDASGNVTFTPQGGFTQDPTPISYTVQDSGARTSNQATITIDYVPVATNDSSINNVTGTVVTVPVLSNDTTGDVPVPGTVQIVGTPGPGVSLVVPGQGTWSVNTGAITFTPAPGFTGDPTPIQYKVQDNDGNTSNPATVTVDYVQYPPVAANDSSLNNPQGSVTLNVTANDTDPNNDLDPGTVDLDLATPGQQATFITPGQGFWQVDDSGNVTFFPNVDFTANPTPILYNVKDRTGLQSNNATITITYVPRADLSITKTDGVTSTVPGTQNTYTIVVSNAGPSAVTGATVSDPLPAGVTSATWTATASSGGSTVSGPSSGTGALATTVNLPVDATITFTFTVQVSPSATGSLTNTATVTPPAGVIDPTTGNNSATDTDSLTPQADLSITKTDGVASAVPGTSTTYTIVVTNNGSSTAVNQTVTDVFPSAITAVNWTAVASPGSSVAAASGTGNINTTVTLLPGGTVTFTAVAQISPDALNRVVTMVNTATVARPAGDTTPGDNTATDTDSLTPLAGLSITKTDGQTTAVPGLSTTYTITVANAGPSAANGAALSDPLPPGVTAATWSLTGATGGGVATGPNSGTGALATTVNLPVGATITFTFTVQIDPAATGSLVNTATATPSGGTPVGVTDTDALTPEADLFITKTDGQTSAVPGTPVTYTITVGNTGPSTVSRFILTDAVPATLLNPVFGTPSAGSYNPATGLWTGLNLATGQSVSITLTGTIDPTATGSLTNTAHVAPPAGVTDPDPTDDNTSDTDTLDVQYDLSITKTDGQTSDIPGTTTTYTIVVTNAGLSAASDVLVSDTLPASLTGVTWSSVGSAGVVGNDVSGSGNINDNVTFIPVGGTVTYTLTGTINPAATGTLSNTATVTGADDTNNANNSATDTTTLTPSADLSITKSNGVTSTVPGTQNTYTIVVTNNGPSAVTGATVSDPLPTGVTFVSATNGATYDAGTNTVHFTTGTLAPGGTSSFQLTVQVSPSATGSLTNTATVTPPAGVTDPSGGNNTATDTDSLTPQADLSITKTDGVLAAVPGTSTTYTIVVTNNGSSTAVNQAVTDVFPSVITAVNWTAGASPGSSVAAASGTGNINTTLTLLPGGTVTFTAVAQISPTAQSQVVTLVNTATVAAPPGDTTPGNNTATDEDSLTPQVGLSITKTDGTTTAVPGTTTTYTITVANAGPSAAIGAALSDPLPPGVTAATWSFTGATGGGVATGPSSGTGALATTVDLPVGATITFTFTVQIDPAATGSLVNTATATPAGGTPIGVTDTDSLTPQADLSVNKTDGVTSAVPGTQNTYTITVTNTGPSMVSRLILTDAVPATLLNPTFGAPSAGSYNPATGLWTGLSLATGQSVSITLTGTIDPTATGSLTNTAHVTPPLGVTDPDPANNNASDTDTLDVQYDLSITKTDGQTSDIPGTSTTYTIVVTNAGLSAASDVLVSDTLPASLTGVTWSSVGSAGVTGNDPSGSGNINDTVTFIPVGGTVTYTVTGTINPAATGTLSNTATVTGADDTNNANNSATDTTTLTPSADLSITKTNGAGTAVAGTNTTYTITVTNSSGPSNVTGATVSDVLPAGATFVSATNGATYDAGTNTVHFTTGTLATGASTSFQLTVAVDPALTGSLVNTATVSPPAGVTDPIGGNNSATDTDTITPQADLSITKTDGGASAVPGTSTTYTIVVSNAGPSAATNVLVADALPAALTGVTWSSVGSTGVTGNDLSGSGNINDTVTLIPVGGTVTYTVTGTINPAATGSLTNTATVTPPAGTTDPDPSDNSDTDTDSLTPLAGLVISKTDGQTTAVPGQSTTYTITVGNAGPSAANGIALSDPLPAGVTSATWSFTGAAGGGSVTGSSSGAGALATTVNLPVGATITFIFTVQIDPAATGSLINTATATPAVGTPTSATDTDSLTPRADLSVTKTDGQTSDIPGTSTTYTIVVTNAGPSAATNVLVSDALPAALTGVTWSSVGSAGVTGNDLSGSGNINDTITFIPVGGTVTYTLTGTIDPTATGSLTNTAIVTPPAGVTDPDPANNNASDTNTLDVQYDLSITKTDGQTSDIPGTTTTYTIVVTNAGLSAATNVLVSDALPASLTGVTWSSVGSAGVTGNDLSGSGNINDTVTFIPVGGTVTYTLTGTINPAATGTLTNTATVTGADDTNNANNSATDTTTLTPSADLSITKTDGVTSTVPGTQNTYTIVVRNQGSSAVTGATVSDPLPTGVTFVSATNGATYDAGTNTVHFTTGTLATGASTSFQLTVQVSPSATGSLTNTATVTPPVGVTDPTPGNNSATDTDSLTPQADLSITKTDGVLTAVPGTSTTYTIVVTNNGSSTAVNQTVTDVFPSAIAAVNWTAVASSGSSVAAASGTGNINTTVTLLPGGTVTFTAVAQISSAAQNEVVTLVNTATVAVPPGDTTPGNNTATDIDGLTPLAGLSIGKNDATTTAVPGLTTSYNIVVSNAGPSAAIGAALSDPLPPGVTAATWAFLAATGGGSVTGPSSGTGALATTVDLPVGATITFTFTVQIDPAATGSLVNTATATPAGGTPVGVTDTDSLTPQADLSVIKTDGVTSAVPGTQNTYTITVTNTGPSTVSRVILTDAVPADLLNPVFGAPSAGSYNPATGLWTGLSLATGQSVSITLTGTIDPTATGSLTNTAHVAPPLGVTDPDPANNNASDTDNLTPSADLSITKTDGQTSDIPGTSTTYTIVVTNAGLSAASDVLVSDTLPASLTGVTWSSVGSAGVTGNDPSGSGNINDTVTFIPVGGTVTYTLTGTINPAATGTLSNTATVTPSAGTTDPNPGNNTATDTTTLTPSADLSITKTDGVASTVPGTQNTYTIVVRNQGSSAVTGATVSDPLPAGVTAAIWTATASSGGGTVSGPSSGTGALATTVNLPVNASVTFTFTVLVSPSATGSLTNTATVTPPASVTDPSGGNNNATDTDSLTPQADLSITKTDGVLAAVPGTSTTYTIVVTNNGSSTAVNQTVTDVFPSAITAVNWTAAASPGSSVAAASGTGNINTTVTLLPGGTVTFTAVAQISPDALNRVVTLVNTATVAVPPGDTTPGNNTATDEDSLTPLAGLSITKTDGQTTAVPGLSTTYTITVSNAGPSAATGATLSDPLPPGVTAATWSLTGATGGGVATGPSSGTGALATTVDLPVGATITFTFTVQIDPAATGSLVNTATATPSGGTPVGVTDTDSLTPQADLSVIKTDGVTSAVPGTQNTYTIVVTNAGPSTVTSLTLIDAVPAALLNPVFGAPSAGSYNPATGLWTGLSLTTGQSVSITLTGTIDPTATGSLTNTAHVTPPLGVTDPDPANNNASDTDNLTPSADLSITKTDGQTSDIPGTTTTYTIVVTNAGLSAASDVLVSDTLPASLTGVTWSSVGSAGVTGNDPSGSGNINDTVTFIPVGGTVTYTLTGTINPAATGTLSNTATVTPSAGTTDPNPGNNTATDTTTLTPSADLSITKTDGVASTVPGTQNTYTIVVRNQGSSAVTGATVSDPLPAGVTAAIWTATASSGGGTVSGPSSGTGALATTVNLPVNASVTFTFTVLVSPSATGSLTNTATVTPPAGVTDPSGGNNNATDTDSLTPQADLSITKTDGVASAVPGTQNTYTIVVRNNGSSTAVDQAVTDVFPSAITAVNWTAVASSGSSVAAASGIGNINTTVTLLPGGTVTFTAVAQISPSATGSLTNTATVAAPPGDTTPGNNSATDTDGLTPLAGLVIAKDDGTTTAVPGTTTTYTITVGNAGPSAAIGVALSDPLPAGVTGATWAFLGETGGGSVTGLSSGTGALATTVNLPVGATITFTFTVQIDPAATGSLVNTATATPPAGTPTSDTDTDSLTPSADLSVIKTNGQASTVPGTPVTYTIVVTNAGPSTVTSLTLIDAVPAALLNPVFGAPSAGSYNPATGLWTGLSLTTGQSVSITLTGTIDPTATGSLTNTAHVAPPAGVTDPDPANNNTSDTDNLTPSADLSITKTDGQTSDIPGTTTTYTIVVTNAGLSAASDVLVSDALPASLTGVTWSSVGSAGVVGNDVSGSGNINDTVTFIPVGGTVTYTLTGTINPAATGTLSNTATVTGADDTNIANNTATDTTTLTPSADLSITKSNGVTSTVPGTQNTYTIVVSNTGPSAVTGATVSDPLPAGVTSATWTATASSGGGTVSGPSSGTGALATTVNLPVNASVTFTFTALVSPSATGSLTNTATVSPPAGVTDPSGGNNTATDTDSLTPQADLSITKTDGVASAVPGTSTTYSIVVRNAGPSTAVDQAVTDVFPSAITSVNWTAVASPGSSVAAASGTGNINTTVTLLPGGTVTFTAVAQISPAATGSLINTATVAVPPGDATADNSATDTDGLTPLAGLVITKTDGTTTAVPGLSTTYTITVGNAGPSAAIGVALSDPLPAGVTGATWAFLGETGGGSVTGLSSGTGALVTTVNLPVGATITFTFAVQIDPAATGSLVNTATATPAVGTPVGATDTDSLTPQADLSVIKTDGQTSDIPGTTTTYTIVVTNAGPSAATNVLVSDALPAALTGVTWSSVGSAGVTGNDLSGSGNINDTITFIPVGGTVTYTLTGTINPAATGSLSNTATVTPPAGVTDPNPVDNTATDTDTLTPSPDLSVTKTDGKTSAVPGTTTIYTIVVTNAGLSAATNVLVSDTLPAALTGVTWSSVGSPGVTGNDLSGSGNINDTVTFIPVGGTVTYTLTGTINPAATGSLTNTATVTGADDTNIANNSATDTTTLTPSADLSITKTDSAASAVAGTNTTYTITVTNVTGPSTVTGATVTDVLPAGVTFVSATNGATYDAGTHTVQFTTGTLATGVSTSFQLTVAVDPAFTGSLTNTATVSPPAGVTDPTPGNNSATDTDTITAQADLSITKTDAFPSVVPGTNTTYTMTVTNSSGPSTVAGATVSDVLPAGVTFVSATNGATYDSGTNTVHFTTGTLVPGASTSFQLTVAISPALTGSLTNTATVSPPAGVTDPIGGNNSATDTDSLTPSADLSITKTDGTTTAVPGTNTTYTVGVTNNGPSTVAGATVSDHLPTGVTFMSATNGATYDSGTNTVHFTTGTLAPGASTSFQLTVAVSLGLTGSLTNTATVSPPAGVTDPIGGNNSATDTDTIGYLVAVKDGPVILNRQTGLFEMKVNVTSHMGRAINGFRLHVDFGAYVAAHPSLRLYNATNAPGSNPAYIDYEFPIGDTQTIAVHLLFYINAGIFPNPFDPILEAVVLEPTNGPGGLPTNGVPITDIHMLPDKSFLLEWASVAGRWYRLSYSSSQRADGSDGKPMVDWFDSPVPIQAGSNRHQLIDRGPPFTEMSPADATPPFSRFYIITEIPAP